MFFSSQLLESGTVNRRKRKIFCINCIQFIIKIKNKLLNILYKLSIPENLKTHWSKKGLYQLKNED